MPGAAGSHAAAAQTDGVDHDLLEAGAVDDVGLAGRPLANTAGAAVLAIAQHEHDLALVFGGAERVERVARSRATAASVHPVRSRWAMRRRARRGARERRADRDVAAERPDPRDVAGPQAREQLRRGAAQQRQVARHAAGHVEHHDQPDRLRAVVELGQRLRFAFVADLEVLAARVVTRRPSRSVTVTNTPIPPKPPRRPI